MTKDHELTAVNKSNIQSRAVDIIILAPIFTMHRKPYLSLRYKLRQTCVFNTELQSAGT
jgi:hypothetical protein